MSATQRPVLLRRLAAFVIRGPDAPVVLADLEELFKRDVDRGLSRWQACSRYAFNTIASSYNIWRARRSLFGKSAGASLLDAKLGVRMLRKQPMLTSVAVLALGLGIPASLSPIHTLNSIMAPLPFEDGKRIVGIRNWDLEVNRPAPRSLHDFAVWREELTSFQWVAASRSAAWNVHSDDGRAEPVRGVEMTGSAFDILRVPPLLGRTLAAADEVIGAPDVVVVGADIWESRFGRDPEIVGKTIRIGGILHTVVGVMPPGFLFPVDDHLWLPLRASPTDYQRGEGPALQVFGRMADGVSMDQARAEVQTVGQRMAAEHPDTHARLRGEVVTIPVLALGLRAGAAPGVNLDIYVTQLFALLLLMIVCGNVGIMILARTATRSGEIAVRTALGASRARIVSQLFVEALVLALLATGLGLFVANWAAHQFQTVISGQLPYWMDMGLGLRSVLLALALGVFSAGVASLVPALKATGRGVQSNLQRSAGRGSAIRFGVGSTVLIVAEVALSVGVLSAGAVWTQTAFQDSTGEMGIELESYLSARLRIPSVEPTLGQAETYRDDFWNQVRTTQLELKRRIAAEPGVLSVAMARDLPGAGHRRRRIEVEGDVGSESSPARVAEAIVDVDFFRDLGRPILEGRDFGSGDIPEEREAHRDAVIVNTTFIEQVLGGRHAIGKRIRFLSDEDPTPWYEIVGVVGPLGMNPQNPARDEGIYHPAGPGEVHPLGLVIEAGDDPAAFTPRLRSIAAEVDATALIQQPMLLSDLADLARSLYRLGGAALVILSVIAIILSAAGLYALMSFTVAQRTREIGIRTALGAHPRSIVYAIARRAGIQLGLGVVLGGAFAAYILAGLSRDPMMQPQNMPLIIASVVAGTMLVGMLACLMPTLRGLRIQPTEALREG